LPWRGQNESLCLFRFRLPGSFLFTLGKSHFQFHVHYPLFILFSRQLALERVAFSVRVETCDLLPILETRLDAGVDLLSDAVQNSARQALFVLRHKLGSFLWTCLSVASQQSGRS